MCQLNKIRHSSAKIEVNTFKQNLKAIGTAVNKSSQNRER